MNALKIQRAIDALSKVIQVPEDKKQEIITRLSSMEEKDVIKELAGYAYRMLGNNEELYTYSLEVIRNINPDICPSVDKMKTVLHNMYENEIEGNMSLEENHKLVIESIIKFTKLLNESGIDYYIVGALPCFLKTGQELFRYHDDIDIMVNEDDIPTLAEIITKAGYEFHDDRFPSVERYEEMQKNKPPHTVLAQNPNNEFHLGFFTFKREPDKSITMREYSHRLENGEVIVDVLERRSDPIGTQLRYDDTPTEYKGTSFRTSTVESVYTLKSYTRRPKDLTDIQKLEPYIDKQKLEEIKKHPSQNVEIQNIGKPRSLNV